MQRFSPVGLVKHHVLHALQLQVHLLDDVHETTGRPDDSVGKENYRISTYDARTGGHTSLIFMSLMQHSHVGVFMKSSKLIVHSVEERRCWLKIIPHLKSTTKQSSCKLARVFTCPHQGSKLS